MVHHQQPRHVRAVVKRPQVARAGGVRNVLGDEDEERRVKRRREDDHGEVGEEGGADVHDAPRRHPRHDVRNDLVAHVLVLWLQLDVAD